MAAVWSFTEPALPAGSEFVATGRSLGSDQQNTYTIDSPNGYCAPMRGGKLCFRLMTRNYIGTGGLGVADASLRVRYRVYKNGVYLPEEFSSVINCRHLDYRFETVYLVVDATSFDFFNVSIYVEKSQRERASIGDMHGTPMAGINVFIRGAETWETSESLGVIQNRLLKDSGGILIHTDGEWRSSR